MYKFKTTPKFVILYRNHDPFSRYNNEARGEAESTEFVLLMHGFHYKLHKFPERGLESLWDQIKPKLETSPTS